VRGVLVLDLETTGLPRDRRVPFWVVDNWPHMVELAWAEFDAAGVERNAHAAIIRPEGYAIPAASTRIHGITQSVALSQGEPVRGVVDALATALADASPTLVAHNLAFDRPILAAEMVRLGLSRAEIEANLMRRPGLCTMEASTAFCGIPGRRGRYKWPTLDELHRKLFGEGVTGGHRALVDVRATARCFFRLQGLGVMG
jgi:DNA polymerase III epsilon subunit-like protein